MNGDKKLATLGLVIAKSYVSDDMPKCTEISISELHDLEKKGFDFFVFVKAYIHCLSANPAYDKDMSLVEAVATVVLEGLSPQGRSREELIELLDVLRVNDSDSFLNEYEELHNRYWVSEVDRNE